MRNFSPIFTLCCAVLLFFHQGACLRCRSGNQQVDAQFQKVLRTCRNRNAGLNTDNAEDSMSSEDSSSESDSNSDEHVYDKNFFYKKGERPSQNQSSSNQRSRNSDSNAYSFDQQVNGNIRDFKNVKQTQRNGDRDSWNSRDARNRKNDSNNGDASSGDIYNNTSREQAAMHRAMLLQRIKCRGSKGVSRKRSSASTDESKYSRSRSERFRGRIDRRMFPLSGVEQTREVRILAEFADVFGREGTTEMRGLGELNRRCLRFRCHYLKDIETTSMQQTVLLHLCVFIYAYKTIRAF